MLSILDSSTMVTRDFNMHCHHSACLSIIKLRSRHRPHGLGLVTLMHCHHSACLSIKAGVPDRSPGRQPALAGWSFRPELKSRTARAQATVGDRYGNVRLYGAVGFGALALGGALLSQTATRDTGLRLLAGAGSPKPQCRTTQAAG